VKEKGINYHHQERDGRGEAEDRLLKQRKQEKDQQLRTLDGRYL